MDSPPAAVWGYLYTLISTDRSQPKIQECMRDPHGRGTLGRWPCSIEELMVGICQADTQAGRSHTSALPHDTQGECIYK